MGVEGHVWYTFLDRVIAIPTWRNVFKKVVLDQTIAAPIYTLTYIVGKEYWFPISNSMSFLFQEHPLSKDESPLEKFSMILNEISFHCTLLIVYSIFLSRSLILNIFHRCIVYHFYPWLHWFSMHLLVLINMNMKTSTCITTRNSLLVTDESFLIG